MQDRPVLKLKLYSMLIYGSGGSFPNWFLAGKKQQKYKVNYDQIKIKQKLNINKYQIKYKIKYSREQ